MGRWNAPKGAVLEQAKAERKRYSPEFKQQALLRAVTNLIASERVSLPKGTMVGQRKPRR